MKPHQSSLQVTQEKYIITFFMDKNAQIHSLHRLGDIEYRVFTKGTATKLKRNGLMKWLACIRLWWQEWYMKGNLVVGRGAFSVVLHSILLKETRIKNDDFFLFESAHRAIFLQYITRGISMGARCIFPVSSSVSLPPLSGNFSEFPLFFLVFFAPF